MLDTSAVMNLFETKHEKWCDLPYNKKVQAAPLLLHQLNNHIELELKQKQAIESVFDLFSQLVDQLADWMKFSASLEYVAGQSETDRRWIRAAIRCIEIMNMMHSHIQNNKEYEVAYYRNLVLLCQLLGHMHITHPIASMRSLIVNFICDVHHRVILQMTNSTQDNKENGVFQQLTRLLSISSWILGEPLVIETSLKKFQSQCSTECENLFTKPRKKEKKKRTHTKQAPQSRSKSGSTSSKTSAKLPHSSQPSSSSNSSSSSSSSSSSTTAVKSPDVWELMSVPNHALLKSLGVRSNDFYRVAVHAHVERFNNQFLESFFAAHPIVVVNQLQSAKNKLFAGKDHAVHMKDSVWIMIERDELDYKMLNSETFVVQTREGERFPRDSVLKISAVLKSEYKKQQSGVSNNDEKKQNGVEQQEEDDVKKPKRTTKLLTSISKENYCMIISLVADDPKTMNKDWLIKHLPATKPRERVRCETCFQDFANQEKKADHVRQTHEKSNIRFWCSYPGCKADFSQSVGLLNHIKTDHMENASLFSCPFEDCKYKRKNEFKTHKNLENHIKSHHSKPHQCPECQFAFAQLKDFRAHVSEVHAEHQSPAIETLMEKLELRKNTQKSLSNRGNAEAGLQIKKPFFSTVPLDLSSVLPIPFFDSTQSILDE